MHKTLTLLRWLGALRSALFISPPLKTFFGFKKDVLTAQVTKGYRQGWEMEASTQLIALRTVTN